MAGPWLIRHLWERVLHGADDDFIRDRAWSPTRGAAEFVLAWLQTMPDGTLGTSPSTSPENAFLTPNGDVAQVATSSAFDLAVVRDLFEILSALALRLGRADDPIVRASSTALQRLRRPHIAPNGSIAEWDTDFTYPDRTTDTSARCTSCIRAIGRSTPPHIPPSYEPSTTAATNPPVGPRLENAATRPHTAGEQGGLTSFA